MELNNRTIGVLVFHPSSRTQLPTLEERNLLYTAGQQFARYLDRIGV